MLSDNQTSRYKNFYYYYYQKYGYCDLKLQIIITFMKFNSQVTYFLFKLSALRTMVLLYFGGI